MQSIQEKPENEDFVLELLDDIGSLKHEQHEIFNTDYMIEVTQEELHNRLQVETDENMKIFCRKLLKFRSPSA